MAVIITISIAVVMVIMLTAVSITPLRLVTHNRHGMHNTGNDTTDGKDDIEGDLFIPVGALCAFAQASDSQGRCDAAESVEFAALAFAHMGYFAVRFLL